MLFEHIKPEGQTLEDYERGLNFAYEKTLY
jgi:hypothetical protein